MKPSKTIVVAVGILAAFVLKSPAQTSVVTVTNVVTVLVTNVITVTNVVGTTPAPAVAPAATPAAVEMTTKYPWASSVIAGLTLTRGNSHTLLYSGDIETAKKTPVNEYSLGAAGAYGSQNSQDDVNNYKGFSQWNHLFSDRFFSYARADASRDIIADLDYRFNFGPGVGYYLIKQTNTTLAVEAGGGYQIEHLGGNYNSFGTMRLAERFEHKFTDRARFWQSAEFIPQVDKLENYAINFEVGLEASISKTFGLRTYLDDNYLSQPASGHYRNDVKLVSGLSYKF